MINVSKRETPDYSANPLKLQREIMDTYIDIEANRMRAWASIGEQSSGTTTIGKPPPVAKMTSIRPFASFRAVRPIGGAQRTNCATRRGPSR